MTEPVPPPQSGRAEPSEIAAAYVVQGRVKWFDAVKGFGFVVADEGGADILLHANVLRNFGQSSVVDGAQVTIEVQQTGRGVQAIKLLAVTAPETAPAAGLEDIAELDAAEVADAPFRPARVKWFDRGKGFGFANVFGSREDVFLHIEVLRQCGFADLQSGEAVAVRVVKGKRGLLAAEVVVWETIELDETL